MTPKKFQIFVSSTYKDLADVWRGVIDSIQRLYHFPVGMEQFSADDDEQWQIIQETIQQTDYYICIIGHRYGSLGKDGVGFTEMEWDYAKSLGIPIMSFVRKREVPTSPTERDSDPTQIEKLNAFISKATDAKMVDFWTDLNDLNTKVVTALYKAFSRKPRPGWIRTESERIAEEMAKLMEENRSLRNDLEKMTSEVSGTRPAFKITLNGLTALSIIRQKKESLMLSQAPSVTPIEWGSIAVELRPFITLKEVEEYNEAIPTTAEIEKTMELIHLVEVAQQTAIPLSITIENIGNAKAREVMVDIVFPEEVILMERYEFDKLKAPDFVFPVNPIVIASQKYKRNKTTKNIFDIFAPNNNYENIFKSAGISSISHTLHNVSRMNRSEHSYETINNQVTITIKNLMHTKKVEFSDLVLIPKSIVNCSIKASIICEEIPKPQMEIIPIEISEPIEAILPK